MPYIGNQHNVGDHVNNFKVLDDISSHTATFNGSATSVVSAADDTIRIPQHRFIQGQRVTYTNGGGGNIGGLTTGTAYFVSFDSANTIKLATTLANANSNTVINISAVGSGTSHTLNAAFDGVNTKFKMTYSSGKSARLNNATQLNVAINNVIQRPNQSALSFTEGFAIEDNHKIVFKVAPTVNDIFWGSIIANTIENFDLRDNEVDNFTGDGSTTEFTLSTIPANNESVIVTIDGVLQHPSDKDTERAYTLIDSILKFTAAPALNAEIQARHIGFAGATTADVSGFYGRTGNVVLGSTDHITTGDITSRNINASGIITASSFRGDGSQLTGIDATALKDTSGNIKIQAHASGAVHTGISTFQDIDVDGHTNLDNLSVAGVSTFTGDATFSGNVSIGGTLTYEDVTNIDSVGIITARNGIDCNGDIDVDGHTNLDNVSVAGVTTFASNVNLGDNDKIILGSGNRFSIYDNGTSAIIDNTYGSGSILRLGSGNQVVLGSPLSNNQTLIRGVVNGPSELYHAGAKKLETYTSGINVTGNTVADGLTIDGDSDLNGDLDVDGHTNLDNVSVAGVSTFTGHIDASGDVYITDKIIHAGDTNTAIRFPSDDTVSVETAGSERLRITSSQTRIGSQAATDTTSYEIQLSGAANNDSILSLYNPTTNNGEGINFGFFFKNSNDTVTEFARIESNAIETTAATAKGDLRFHTRSGSAGFSNASERLRITSGGTVNIGGNYSHTSSKLQITGNSTFNGDIDVDGHTNLDNVSIAGVTTFAGAIDANGDLDVDGHTNLDNVSIAGVATATSFSGNGSNLTALNIVTDTSPQLGADLDVNDFDIKNGNAIYEIILNQRHNFYSGGNKIVDINGNGVDFVYGNNTHADSVESRFGTGNDMKLYHNGSNSFIQHSGTGDLYIDTLNNSADMYIRSKDNLHLMTNNNAQNSVVCVGNGGVILYTAGNQKFTTDHDGATITGRLAFTSAPAKAITLADNKRIYFGDGDDMWIGSNGSNGEVSGSLWLYNHLYLYDNVRLRIGNGQDIDIFHDTSSNRINSSNAPLAIQSVTQHDITISHAGADMIRCKPDAEVELSYSGSMKLETRTDGVLVSGDLYNTTNLNSTGDKGFSVGNGNRLGFDQSGTRSWNVKANSGNLEFRSGDGNGIHYFYTDVTSSGYVDSASDIKLKRNIKTIDNALDKVLQLRGAEYDRIDKDNQHEIGVIAQEVEKIIPEVVHGEDTKTVSYGNMVAVLIEAIKEQNEVINKMKKEIEDLKE